MNIYIIGINDNKPSGVVRFQEALRELIKFNNKIKIFYISFDKDIISCYHEEIGNRIIQIHIPLSNGTEIIKTPLTILELHYEAIYVIIKNLINKELNNNIFHIQEFFLIKFANFLKNKIGGKIICHVHVIPWKLSYEEHEEMFTNYYRQTIDHNYIFLKKNKLEYEAYLKSDHIICVSNHGKNHVQSVYNIPDNKISVIYNGIKDTNVKNCGITYKIKNPELIFVGRTSREKGIYILLDALVVLYQIGMSPKLNIFGEYNNQLYNSINSGKYKNLNIELHGKVSFETLSQYYRKPVIGIIPSIHEQCSYVAIEMSMYGVPIIASNVDALTEIFNDKINALKYEVKFDYDLGLCVDIKDLAKKIEQLINNYSLREELYKNARKNYLNNFSHERMIYKLYNTYKNCLI